MAAKKNPKRVAAGKKAWRSRGKGKKKGGGGGARGRGGRKPIQRGISGKIGAFVLGVMPPALSGVEAAGSAMAKKKDWNLSPMSTVQYGLYRWLNNLSMGFLGTVPFEHAELSNADGQSSRMRIDAGLPKGSLWSVAGVGLLMMVYDYAASKLAGGRPIKIPMTNYNATGGS